MEEGYFKAIFIICLISFEIFFGLCSAVLPWYYVISIGIFSLMAIIFLARLEIGAYLLIFFVFVFGNYIGFAINTEGATVRSLIPFYVLIYFSVVAAFIAHKVARTRDPFKAKNPLDIPIYILLFYSLLTIIFSFTGYYLIMWFLLFLNIGIYYFVVSIADNEGFHRRLMWFFILGGNILSMLVVVSILVHPLILRYFKIFDWLDLVVNYAPHVQIRGYAIGHPNHTSLLLNMASCVMLGMFIYEKDGYRKKFLLISLGFCVFANFLTMSKAGIGSLWAMMHFIILFSSSLRKNMIRNVILFNTLFVLIFIISVIFSKQSSPRILKVSEKGGYATSVGSRMEIWKAGLRAMQKKSMTPFGLGAGGFDLNTQFPHSHSLYLSFFFDFGIVGIICICLIMIILFMEFFVKEWNGMLFSQRTYFDIMALAFLGGIVCISIHGLVDHSYAKGVLWLFLGFAMSTLYHSQLERGIKDVRI
ncbi:O-antigen ligase family protein [bacterium]|nr:O-antigen ligase family protein [bacterium]